MRRLKALARSVSAILVPGLLGLLLVVPSAMAQLTPTPIITPTPTATLTPTVTPTFWVQAITPASGPATGSTAVSITGAGFQDGATLSIGGIPATGVQFLSSQQIAAYTPELQPGTLSGVTVINPDLVAATLANGWLADFLDVPQSDAIHAYVEELIRNGITAGCGGGDYCPDDSVTRAQIAVFLLKGEHGGGYVPPVCSATLFTDMPCPGGPNVDWVNQVAAEGITAGCGNGDFCPSDPVRRDQIAVFLLKAQHGSTYVPPPCVGVFADVPCPSQFADWIEQFYFEGITGGCGEAMYCPRSPVSRGQTAVFLVKAFILSVTPRPTFTPTPTPTPPSQVSVNLHADCGSCGLDGHICIMQFLPNTVVVAVGGTVTWGFAPNGDPFEPLSHSITGSGFDSGVHTGAFTYSHTFDQAGTYSYDCSVGHLFPKEPCPFGLCCTTIRYESGTVLVVP